MQIKESFQSKLLRFYLKISNVKRYCNFKENNILFLREKLNYYGNNLKEIEKKVISGTDCFQFKPKKIKSNSIILYFHGGAYVSGPMKIHWKFLSKLSNYIGIKIIMIDYAKSPENTYIDTHQEISKVYYEIIKEYNASNVILMGDSAGGALALSLSMSIRDQEKPLPGKIILISPWLDIKLNNKNINKIEKRDLILSRKGLINAGKFYANKQNADDYLLSPLKGKLDRLPPILMFAGTNEILVFDCRKLYSSGKKNKNSLTYIECMNLVHAWVLFDFLPESKDAMSQIEQFLFNNIKIKN